MPRRTMSKKPPTPRSDTDDASSVFSSYSAVSVTSTYRHHQASRFMPSQVESPKPVLVKDSQHTPATTGSFGMMIVGLGGANGTVLLAGILANRLKVEWHGPRGEPMSPNYYGCITQLNQKGGGVGYKDKVRGLADASMAAIGGWVRLFSGRTTTTTTTTTTVQPLCSNLFLLCATTGHSTDQTW